MLKKFFSFLCLLILIGGVLYLFRTPVLRSASVFLIKEDSLQKADAMFVLSGGGYERGNEAAKIYGEGFVPKIICTGANVEMQFKVFGIDTLESDATVADLKRLGIADSVIVKIPEGTSTREESDVILKYCLQHKFKKIMIVSSKLHTRRVNSVFRKKLEDGGIVLVVRGAHSATFNEMLWWQDENGLIAVNNEWVKTFYYWWKY